MTEQLCGKRAVAEGVGGRVVLQAAPSAAAAPIALLPEGSLVTAYAVGEGWFAVRAGCSIGFLPDAALVLLAE